MESTRIAFTAQDQHYIVEWVARKNPENKGRRGNVLWRELTTDHWAKQWSFRHSWQSWRDQYVRNADQYDVLIEKKIQELQKSQLPNNSQHAVRPPTPPSFSDGQPGRPLSLTVATNANLFSSATGDPAKATLVSSTQATVSTLPPLSHSEVDPEDLEYLASYFASNSIAKDDREKANTYQDMRDDASCGGWVKKHTGYDWRSLYHSHRQAIDKQVEELLSRTDASAEPQEVPNPKKRSRRKIEAEDINGEEDHAEQRIAHGKKRKFEQSTSSVPVTEVDRTGAAKLLSVPQEPVSSEVHVEEGSQAPRKPIVYALGTPSSTTPSLPIQPTQRIISLSVDKSAHLPSPVSPARSTEGLPNVHHGVDSRANHDVSPVLISPESSPQRPDPSIDRHESISLPKVVSNALQMFDQYGFGQYGIQGPPVGAISPSQEEKVPSQSHADELVPTGENIKFSAEPEPTTQTMRLIGAKKSGGIFPNLLPSLTPFLRGEKRSWKQDVVPPPNQKMNSGDESAKGSGKEAAEVEQVLDVQEMKSPLDERTEQSSRSEKMLPTPDFGSKEAPLDRIVGEEEGPSPMPNMGSRPSSRAPSFSYGQCDVLVRMSNSVSDEEGVNELEGEVLSDPRQEEEPDEMPEIVPKPNRFFVPKQRSRRPSESSLFTSGSAFPAEEELEEKKALKGVHYPVVVKQTVFGILRDRETRRSLGQEDSGEGKRGSSNGKAEKESTVAVGGAQEDYESDVIEIDTSSDKENVIQGKSPSNCSDVVRARTTREEIEKFPPETYETDRSPRTLHRRHEIPTPGSSSNQLLERPLLPLSSKSLSASPGLFTVHATSKIGNDPFLDSGRHNQGRNAFKSALHYTAPHVSRHMEAALEKAEEPSPLAQKAEQRKKGERQRHSLGEKGDAVERRAKVRFGGVTVDRDRRKTTGGFGLDYEGGGTRKGPPSSSNARASRRSSQLFLKEDPVLKETRAQMGLPQKGSTPGEAIDLNDEENAEEDESPLARYSQSHAASSQINSSTFKVARTPIDERVRSEHRSSHRRVPPLPSGIPVPILRSSSPNMPESSPFAYTTQTKKPQRDAAMNGVGAPNWSPLHFDQPSFQPSLGSRDPRSSDASSYQQAGMNDQTEEDQIPSVDFRDQRRDAEWVTAARGRPVITAKKVNPRGRNAPLPGFKEEVVYVSSPSLRPSRNYPRRQSSERRANSHVSATPLTQDDRDTIIRYLEEQQLINEEEEVGLETLMDGLADIFQTMASSNGFDTSVPRNVWMQCGSIIKTATIIQTMTDAANDAGLKQLKEEQRKDTALRDEWLRKSLDGRRVSGFSNRSQDVSIPTNGEAYVDD